MKRLSLIILSLHSFSSFSFSIDKAEEIKWAPTNLSPILLTNTLEFNYCNKDEFRFRGCFAAVERFYKFKNPELSLAINDNEIITVKDEFFINRHVNYKAFIKNKRERLDIVTTQKNDEVLKKLLEFYKIEEKKYENIPAHITALSVNEFNAVTYDPFKVYEPLFKYNGLNQISIPPSIGIELSIEKGNVYVDRTYVESPAYLAGFKPYDHIIEINGEKIQNYDNDLLDQKLQFQENEIVNFKILRNNKTLSIDVKFGYQKYPPVVDKTVTLGDKKFTYLHMKEIPSDFDPELTCKIFKKILTKFNNETDGMVLDLRDNVGGYSETAACIASLFLGKNKNLFTEYDLMNNPVEEKISSLEKVFKKPVVTLINEATASSGEILAGVLNFYGRSPLIGTRSFGKGIGQITETFKTPFGGLDKIELHYTSLVMRYPDGTSHQNKGLIPDYLVYLSGAEPVTFENKVLRMEDYAVYPIMLDNVKSKLSKTPSKRVSEKCLSQKNLESLFRDAGEFSFLNDKQLQTALAILDCK